ncbi:MAG: hypothetical protein HY717_18270 [Planctomycetes bacterium]|nr:hypothetical protein [Planctomycetota bacterium]
MALEERTLRIRAPGCDGPSGDGDLRLHFEDSPGPIRIDGEGELPGRTAFFRGKDPDAWQSGVRCYRSVRYEALYECIDMRVHLENGPLEYDLLLYPGAAVDAVRIRLVGSGRLTLMDDGYLAIEKSSGFLTLAPPKAWGEPNRGERRLVGCAYRLIDDRCFGFELEGPPSNDLLIIDPQLGFIGGDGSDNANSIAEGKDGSIYLASVTNSFDFPMPEGSPRMDRNGGDDVVLSKFDPDGSRLQWLAVLAGSLDDDPTEIKVDESGLVTVVGWTISADFPVTPGAFDDSQKGGRDAFLARLKPDPTLEPEEQLLYSTFLGGSGEDLATALEIDPAGIAHITGSTASSDFPTTEGAYDGSWNGRRDVFYAKVLPDRGVDPSQQLLYSTYLGGTSNDTDDYKGSQNIWWLMTQQNIALGKDGTVALAGSTNSPDFPVTPNAFQPRHQGDVDIYVALLRPDPELGEDQLIASTFLGTTGGEWACGVAFLENGEIGIVGTTEDDSIPTTPDAFRRYRPQPQTFSLCAGGDDLTGPSDQLHFVHREFTGDAVLTARVTEMSGRTGSSVGLMLRGGLPPGASHVSILLANTSGGKFSFRRRDIPGQSAESPQNSAENYTLPAWIRLERKSGAITASFATVDPPRAEDWKVLGQVADTLPDPVLGGIAANGSDPGGVVSYEPLRATVCLQENPAPSFRRGDLDNSGAVDISDPINGLHTLFLGGFEITCQDAADFDDSGEVDLSDMINSLLWQFASGEIAPLPGPFTCGNDPTSDKMAPDIGCQSYSAQCVAI